MSTVCTLIPQGWLCSLDECPPGLFTFVFGDDHNCIGFKSEYKRVIALGAHQKPVEAEAFNEAGEYLTLESYAQVQPLIVNWEET